VIDGMGLDVFGAIPYEACKVVFDPLHYLAPREQKTRTLDQVGPLVGWRLPECFMQLRRLLEARLKKNGGVSMCRCCGSWRPSPSMK
ncbi:MAG: hypothetical protein ABSG51_17050, partial [Terracidiphilus sp.]